MVMSSVVNRHNLTDAVGFSLITHPTPGFFVLQVHTLSSTAVLLGCGVAFFFFLLQEVFLNFFCTVKCKV